MAWTHAGLAALQRVRIIVYGNNNNFDPYAGNLYRDWSPVGARIGFEHNIIAHIDQIAPRDGGDPAWYTCAYCNWEYPRNRCQIDHIVPWAVHSQAMTTDLLWDALAIQVWVGCNDPANLTIACQPCNGAKSNNPLTQAFIDTRRALATQNGGF